MRLINVGIDIDGVLRVFFPHALNHFINAYPEYAQYFKKPYDIFDYDAHHWILNSAPNKESLLEKFNHHMYAGESCLDIYSNAPIYNDATDFNSQIQKLKSALSGIVDVNVCFASYQDGYEMKQGTIYWLKNHNITNFDGVIFSKHKDRYGLTYLLEDNVGNAHKAQLSGVVSMLRLRPYNESCRHEFEYLISRFSEYIDHIISIEKINYMEDKQ